MSKNDFPKKVFEKKIENFTTREEKVFRPVFHVFLSLCSADPSGSLSSKI
jgi:hypothetical protein